MPENSKELKIWSLAILCLLPTIDSNAQFVSDSTYERSRAFYLEILGNGGLYSVNVENGISDHFKYRIGVLYQWGPTTGPGVVPEIIYLFGKRKRFDIGAGFSLRYLKDRDDAFSNFDQDFFIYNTLRVGYNLIGNDKRLLLKISALIFTTIYDPLDEIAVYPSLGVSVGFREHPKKK
jgi:hypothetical protein